MSTLSEYQICNRCYRHLPPGGILCLGNEFLGSSVRLHVNNDTHIGNWSKEVLSFIFCTRRLVQSSPMFGARLLCCPSNSSDFGDKSHGPSQSLESSKQYSACGRSIVFASTNLPSRLWFGASFSISLYTNVAHFWYQLFLATFGRHDGFCRFYKVNNHRQE